MIAPIQNPADRRWYLLVKALEILPLDKALALAKEADEFLYGPAHDGAESNIRVGNGHDRDPLTIDEVVSFLRQESHTVSNQNGQFLVDDKMLTLPELVEFANNIRNERKLPPFQLYRHKASMLAGQHQDGE